METTSQTPETQYALVENKKIAYRKLGTGSPILIFNRFRGTLDTYDPLFLQNLAKSHTVITFDYPGIGYSEGELPLNVVEVAGETKKLADTLKLEKFDILGWSYGGQIAQYFAFLYPQNVRKAVFIGTNPPGKNEIPFEPVFAERALKPEYNLDDYTVLFFEPKSEKSRFAAKASMERTWPYMDGSKVPMKQEVIQRYAAGMRGAFEDKEGYRNKFGSTDIPMLVISGDHDISFAVENWYPIIRNAPTLQLIVLPEAGHGSFFQYPELTVGYINNFLDI